MDKKDNGFKKIIIARYAQWRYSFDKSTAIFARIVIDRFYKMPAIRIAKTDTPFPRAMLNIVL